MEVWERVGSLGVGKETCVDPDGGTCSQVGSGGERDSCYENRRHDCGAAHEECCGSVWASAGLLFEALYGRPIHPLVKEPKKEDKRE